MGCVCVLGGGGGGGGGVRLAGYFWLDWLIQRNVAWCGSKLTPQTLSRGCSMIITRAFSFTYTTITVNN